MSALLAGSLPSDSASSTYRVRHKAGYWVWVEAAIKLLRDSRTRGPQSLILALRDVTERQRAARHLERVTVEAEKVANLKSEFLANMSHELRTPLTGVLGLHDLLASDPTLSVKQKRQVELAREAGRSLLGIVNDILDFSKIESGHLAIELAPFDLANVIEACRALGQQDARRKSLAVAADYFDIPPLLVGDAAPGPPDHPQSRHQCGEVH
jgi:signal transduction histidine kinase